MALLVVGLFLPWVTLYFTAHYTVFAAVDLPILGWFGATWVLVLVAVTLLARMTASRTISMVAALTTTFSAAIALVATLVLWRIPRLFPLWVVPVQYRDYAPTVRSGAGPATVTAGCVLMAIWSIEEFQLQMRAYKQAPGTEKGWTTELTSRFRPAPPTGEPDWSTPVEAPTDGLVDGEDIWGPSPW